MNQKQFIFHLRYPYAAAVIIVIWVGTIMMLLKWGSEMSLWRTLIIDAVASLVVAYVGFLKK